MSFLFSTQVRQRFSHLAIVIQGIKWKYKYIKNFLPYLFVLFKVCSQHFWLFQHGGGSTNTANCTENYAPNNIKKPQTALKLIFKYGKPLCFVKPQYRNLKLKFPQNSNQNRAKNGSPQTLTRPFSTILASFSYCHATVAPYRIPGQLHTERGQRQN